MQKVVNLMRGLNRVAFQCARDISHSRQRELAPSDLLNEDVFLVSFPKSGSTWMNFLIANVNMVMSQQSRAVTFYNIHQYVPDIHSSRYLGPPLLSFPGFRFIKSHSAVNRYYQHVVFVVRNPEDVLISYYHFLQGLKQFPGTISDLIRSKKFGIRAWCRHTEGWLMQSSPSVAFMTVKYEDLINDPHSALKRVYASLGIVLSQQVLDSAIQRSSFSEMARLEKETAYGGREFARTFRFMRSGKSNSGKEELSDMDRHFIAKHAGPIMETLGYL